MKANELDAIYTALAEALGRAPGERHSLMLAILALDLLARGDDPGTAIAAISTAERLSGV